MIEQEVLTRAARTGSVALVRAAIVDAAITHADEARKDERDLMMALAPIHHCAHRIGADVPALFDSVADEAPADLQEVLRIFGRRTDVSPRSFDFLVEETPAGPRYGHPDHHAELSDLLRWFNEEG